MQILNRSLAGSILTGIVVVSTASAQVPGVAVMQNAFTSRGLAFAANFGSSAGQSFFGGAAGWGLTDRIQVSGAGGVQRSGNTTRGAYGARATMGVWSSRGGALGGAAFVGIGGAARTRTGAVVTNPAIMSIPAGVSLGYRRGMGARRSISGYVSPFYNWARVDSGTGTITSTGAFRTSVGVDIGLSANLGASIGGEFGAKRAGSGGGVLGAAITFVPGRR